LKKLMLLVVLLAGCGYAGSQGYDWVHYQVNAPMSSRPQTVTLHITEGESPDDIAQDLYGKGLIRSRDVFVYYLRYSGARSRLQAGDFVLDRSMSVAQITDVLQHTRPSQVAVRLAEGLTLNLMATQSEKAGLGPAAAYVAAAGDQSWQYDFLKDKPPGASLEGFLFPDTYALDKSSKARDLVKRQLDRFGEVVTPQLRAQAAQRGMSLYDILKLASMVEREANQDRDRPVVCSVYYNRLAADMTLSVDATVLYGLGQWNTQPDITKDTPYNTYIHKGLPPTPIANPGLAAIQACLNPQKTDYKFYFTDPKGVTHFSATAADFEQKKRQFGVGP
jgi:UPF0755 protein